MIFGLFSYDWTILLVIPGFIISLWAQIRVTSTFKKYSQMRTMRGMTGYMAARRILDENGLLYVNIEQIGGHLSDHFDPRANVIRLSGEVYHSTSPAAIGETVVVDTETGDAVSGAAPLEAHPDVVSGDFLNGDGQYEGFIEAQEQADGKARKKKLAFSDNDAVDLCLPVDSIDRSVKLVESRLLYEIESMKTERRMLGYTFSLDLLKKDQTAHKMRRQINERMSKLSRALENERDSSTRYYSAALDRYEGNAGKRRKNAALIESLLGRLDYALKEREQIEEKLMRLYVMDADEAEPTKEAKVAARAAKASYRSQLKTARRVARMHAPDELKEKIFTLMNERTTMLATIEKNEYLLRKKRYTGADKRDAKRQNREMRRAIRHKEADVRFFIKKAEKHDTAHGDGIRQVGWLVATLIIAGAIGGLYLLGKYYWGLF